jgi:rhizosphere induced protein
MTQMAAPASRALFTWTETFALHWRERDARTSITASQTRDADLDGHNQVTLSFDRRRRAYSFRHHRRGPRRGKLYILQDDSVPLRRADIGVTMSGRLVHLVRAQPNVGLIFRPEAEYWIAFGTFTEGEPLDLRALSRHAARIPFATGITALKATVDTANIWHFEIRR